MAKLTLRTTILSKLSSLVRKEGNLIITRDGETLYFDTESKRFKISDFIDVADDNDRLAILAPNTEKMYYVLSTNAVWRYISGTWYEVTSTEDVSDILSSLSNKADSNKAYLTDDSTSTDIADGDYIPLSSASAKKKSTFSNFVAKIKAKLITDTYSGTSTTGMSGKAVKSAIDALDGNLNNTTPSASKTLTAFSQTDGKVSATFGDINISKSQINDFPTIPTVNDATLTIQKNGTNVQTFTANASSNKTANITVPTTQADLTEVRLTNEDLNNVTYPGFYYAAGGNTITNKPTGYNNFGLVVVHNANQSQYTQIISNENGSYRRIKKADGTWTSWAEDKFTDTIPNNATLSIQLNGESVNSFTANASSNVTADIHAAVNYELMTEDLDDVKTVGFYIGKQNNTCANKPSGFNQFGLYVIRTATSGTGNYYKQTLIRPTSGEIWSRDCVNGTWSTWTQEITTDENVKQNASITTNADYRVLLSKSASDSEETDGVNKSTNLKYNPSTTALTVPKIVASSTQDASGTSDNKPALMVGNISGTHLEFDTNEIMAKASGTTTTTLHINTDGGKVVINNNTQGIELSDGTIMLKASNGKTTKILPSEANANRNYYLPNGKDDNSELAVTSDIPTALADLTDDATHRVVTDTQISSWDAKAGSDVNVTQTLVSTNKNYPLLFSTRETSDTTASRTGTAQRNNSIYVNPSTGNLQTTKINGVEVGSSPKFTDENVKQTQIEASDTGWYRLLLSNTSSGTLTGGANKTEGVSYKRSTSMLSIDSADGVAGTAKLNYLKIGNETSSSDDGNTQGDIRLCSSNSGYIDMRLASTTQKRVVTFPDPGSGNKTVMYQSNMSTSELVTGTATTTRTVRADYLNAAIKQLIDDHEASKSCIVGKESNSYTWCRVAQVIFTGDARDDASMMLAVNNTFSSNNQSNEGSGILYVHVRTTNAHTSESMSLKFISKENLNSDDFKLGYNVDSDGKVWYYLYTKISVNYMYRRFTILSQGMRTTAYEKVWTLNSENTPAANLPNGFTWISADNPT